MATKPTSPKNKQKQQSTRDALSTFVPETMKWILQTETIEKHPYSKQFPSVALFADISGFTNLTEKLSALPGTLGVEVLADEINNYLTQIIKQIVGSGGDIFKFAGDALLCVWPPNQDEINNQILAWKNLSNTVLRVIRCALDIQNGLGEMSKCGVPDLTLRVKLGIGVGIVDVLVVGGVMKRYENLPAGQAFFEAFNCENDCEPKQVIISQKCYQMTKDHIGECEEVGKIGNYLVKSIKFRIGKRRNVKGDDFAKNLHKNDDFFKKFSRYIPSAVVPHLRMPEQAWVGELRQVTIMFLSLPFNSTDIKNISSGGEVGKKVLHDIHSSICVLQEIIYKYQGSLNKFLVDDKGSTVMAVFGLPPVAHRNDPERAVMAALDLRKKFIEMGNRRFGMNLLSSLGKTALDINKTQSDYDRDKHKKKKKKDKKDSVKKKGTTPKRNIIAIGITSGIVYLGLVGGAGSRREYSVLGDKVNLAARLMGLSKKAPNVYSEIAVDESIKSKVDMSAMKHYFDWQFIKNTKVKGKKQRINVYKPVPKKFIPSIVEPPIAWLTDASDKSYITQCSKVIESLHKEQIGKVVFVEGEAGLGKAALIRRVMDQTKNRIWWLWGKGHWVHETKPEMQSKDNKFPVWRQILLSFCEKYPFFEEKNRQHFVKYIHKRRPDLEKWVFLLSYFDLVSFVSPNEYDPIKDSANQKRTLTEKMLKGTIWARNEKLVSELKDRVQLKMSEQITAFEYTLTQNSKLSESDRQKLRKEKEKEWAKEAEGKVDKKISIYTYDIVLCLLEWAGGKQLGIKPIAVVIDGLQWLRSSDWSLTRRLIAMLNSNWSPRRKLKHIALFITSTPMDIKRYTPHYIKHKYTPEYQQMRDKNGAIIIIPAAWGIQKTKKYIKSYFKHNHDINVRDVSPKLVETVHSQSGGRPGFCKAFLDVLMRKNEENLSHRPNKLPPILSFVDMRYGGEKKLSFSTEFEEHLASKTYYASIPIPAEVLAISARHLDVLPPEAMLCLRTAASICIAKGMRSLTFLKSTLMGSHPIKQFVDDKKKMNETLEQLVKMKFIVKLEESDRDISHVINEQKVGNAYTTHSIVHHAQPKEHGKNSIKGRYGGGINNVVTRNKMHDSMSDGMMAFGANTHMRSFSSTSQSIASDQSNGGMDEDEIRNQKTLRDENKHKITENMPLTSTLVNEPVHKIRWKKGVLNKSGGGMLNKWQERVFVFKGKTLFWFRSTNIDKYPLGRIKFDESILRLRCNEKKNEITIKVSRKKYVLRAKGLDEMKEWFELFQTAMNSDLNDEKIQNENVKNESTDDQSVQTLTTMTMTTPMPMNNNKMENVEENAIDFGVISGECYEFTHGFLRDAIYEQMLSTQRIRIHKSAQEYLRKILKAISVLPNYQNKDSDTRDYTMLLQRHKSIASNYQSQIQNIGLMVADDKKKSKKGSRKFPGFAG